MRDTAHSISLRFGLMLIVILLLSIFPRTSFAAEQNFGLNIARLSTDGRWIAFSTFSKLVPEDNNNAYDVYVYDRSTGDTELVSKDASGAQIQTSTIVSSISGNGRYVLFYAQANAPGSYEALLYDRVAKSSKIIGGPVPAELVNNQAYLSAISGDNNSVVFISGSGASLSRYNTDSGEITKLPIGNFANIYDVAISNDGDKIFFLSGTVGAANAFLYTLSTNTTTKLNINQIEHANLSGNGSVVVWSADSKIFSLNLNGGEPEQIASNGDNPRASSDGKIIVFQSKVDYLKNGSATAFNQVYAWNADTKTYTRVSSDSNGEALQADALYPMVSSDGKQVTYTSGNMAFTKEVANKQDSGTVAEGHPVSQNHEQQQSQNSSSDLGAINLGFLLLNAFLIFFLKPLESLTSLISLGNYTLYYTRAIQSVLSFLGLRRKRRVWGTVYDSITKQPLDPAVVELVDSKTGKVLETAITDLAGRFGFLATTGTFLLKAKKTHYSFPSIKQPGFSDEIFGNLYHGEVLNLSEGATLVAPNIPMDQIGFDWNQDAKEKLIPSRIRLLNWIQTISNILFAFGFLSALVNYILNSSGSSIAILCLYILVLIVRILFRDKHLWGRLTQNGQPLIGAYLELVEGHGIVMGKAISAIDGKFFLKTPSAGEYNLTIKSSVSGEIIERGKVMVDKDCVLNDEIKV